MDKEYYMCSNCGVKVAKVVAEKYEFECHLCNRGAFRKVGD